jgi:hypothetical protein
MKAYDDYLRRIYRGGRPDRFAKLQNDWSARVFAAGIWPRRAAALEVRGRTSGRTVRLPVVIAEHDGERFLVSMLGEANWVRNVRAAGGRAVLRHGKREEILLEVVPVTDRPAVIKRYLEVAPGARPHIPVDRTAPIEDFRAIAASIPVFRVTPGFSTPAPTSPPPAPRVRRSGLLSGVSGQATGIRRPAPCAPSNHR